MSLILRKKCEQVLEASMLADYHTRIDNSNNLQIVGPCGQPLFSISGIKFSRSVPNTMEIIYAVELLEQFCNTHKVDILNVLKTKAALFKAVEPKIPSAYTINLRDRFVKLVPFAGDLRVYYYIDDGTIQIGCSGCNNEDVVTIIDIKSLTKSALYKTMRRYYKT